MYRKFLGQFNEVKKVEKISLCKNMLTHYIVTLQNGKRIAVHLMVLDEWLLRWIETLPDLMAWIIEEIKTKECLEAYPMVLLVKDDTITQESQRRYMSIVDVMQRRC